MDAISQVTRLMDLKELASLWRVSPHTIRAWVRQKRLNPTKICRRLPEWRDLLFPKGGAGGDRTMESAVQHGAAAFIAGLQATGPSDDDARSRT